jgi:hypothetical protein
VNISCLYGLGYCYVYHDGMSDDGERYKSTRRDIDHNKHGYQDASKHHHSYHHDKHSSNQDHRDKKYSLLHSGHHSADLVDMATECFKALDLLSVLSLDNLP